MEKIFFKEQQCIHNLRYRFIHTQCLHTMHLRYIVTSPVSFLQEFLSFISVNDKSPAALGGEGKKYFQLQ